MKRSKLLEIIRQVLAEDGNVTANVGPTATPNIFAKPGQGDNPATTMMKKTFGYKAAPRPKHPSESKMISYLQERGAGHYATPHVFVSEEEMMNSEAVKHTEEMGYKLVSKNKKASDKKSK
jgi:hypothetical protein